MRQILVAFLFCLAHSVVNAQVFNYEMPVTCGNVEQVFAQIKNEFKEAPTWTGFNNTDNSFLALFANAATGSWTIIKYNRRFACVLGVGIDSKPQFGVPA